MLIHLDDLLLPTHARMEGGESATHELLALSDLYWWVATTSIDASLTLINLNWRLWLSHELCTLLHAAKERVLAILVVCRDARVRGVIVVLEPLLRVLLVQILLVIELRCLRCI